MAGARCASSGSAPRRRRCWMRGTRWRTGWTTRDGRGDGWCAYFRPGVSSGTFGYLAAIAWRQVLAWLRRKHRRITWKALRRRYCGGGWWPADGNTRLLHTGTISTTRYRYRGAAIPTPWQAAMSTHARTGLVESPVPG